MTRVRARLRGPEIVPEIGLVPAKAAEQIAARSSVEALDFELHETENVGYPILPLVHQLVKQCGEVGR